MAVIKVTGSAECALPVDTATVHLTVKRVRKTANEASKDVKEEVEKLGKRLAANSFTQTSLKTTSFSVAPEYEFADGKRVLLGYACRCRMKCEFAYTPEAVINAVSAMTEGDGEEEFGLSFGVKDEKEVRRALLAEACKDAKSKAEAVASAFGKRLGGCVKTEECDPSGGAYAARCLSANAVGAEDARICISVFTEWETL